MNEKSYRVCIVVLLAIVVTGSLIAAFRLTGAVSRMAENGRYVQFSKAAMHSPSGASDGRRLLSDTRSGELVQATPDAGGIPRYVP